MRSIRAMVCGGLLAVALVPAAMAEPTDNTRRTPPPEADSAPQSQQRVCQIFAGGVVRIDGRYAAWREDWCGTLTRGARAAMCEPNASLKLWRLYWNDRFWIYVPMTKHSKTIATMCPPGVEDQAMNAGPWNTMPPREDDVILQPKH